MLERIIALIEREMASIEHSVLKGACPDFTSYREQVAALATYYVAMEIVKKAFSEEDEDE